MQQYLADLIRINGPISVSSYINEVLYNPKYGYYTNQNTKQTPFGKGGDFITSPEISQVFGELIGAYMVNLWQSNYQSQPVTLVEMGAGNATLMYDLLSSATKVPGFLKNVTINIVEISPKLRKIQQEKLSNFNIKWHHSFHDFFEDNPDKPILFIANELLDCFAIDQYVKIDNFWIQKLVALNKKNKLEFILSQQNPQINKTINDLINDKGIDGSVFEHSSSLDNFMKELSSAIKQTSGIAIMIDYGFIKNHFRESLQAIKNHKYANILEDIGCCDISSLVNFSRLVQISNKNGLKSWLVTQKEFLESLGIEIRRQKLLQNKTTSKQDEINSSINRLIDKDKMGELFKVLIISY